MMSKAIGTRRRSGRLVLALSLGMLACGQTSSLVSSPTATSTSSSAATSPLWYLTRGGAETDEGWGVDVDAQGNVYVATHQAQPLLLDIVVYKFSPTGKELWKQTWKQPWSDKAFIVTVSGSVVYVGGATQHAQSSTLTLETTDMVVLALNASDGSLVWQRTWDGGHGYDEVDGLVADGDALYVSGWTRGATTTEDLALLQLDRASGQVRWAQTWGGPLWDEANGQMVVDQDAIYLAGHYGAPDGFNGLVGGRGVVAKFSKQTGEHVADAEWGAGGLLPEDALGLTSDGQALYAIGLSGNHGAGGQIVIRKYAKDLTLQWERVWGGAKGESARAGVVDATGDLLVAGNTESTGAGGKDVVLLRYHPNGDLVWSHTWGEPGDDSALGAALAGGVLYLAGQTSSVGAGKSDALLLKVSAATGQFPEMSQRVS
jgi:hypothetical protein